MKKVMKGIIASFILTLILVITVMNPVSTVIMTKAIKQDYLLETGVDTNFDKGYGELELIPVAAVDSNLSISSSMKTPSCFSEEKYR